MPTYGYRCVSCGHEFERFQKITDAPVAECEKCGAPVKKMIYPVGIQFKGPGFYVNDSAKPVSKDSAEKPADKPAEAETKTETKPDTATAPTAPASDSKPAAAAAAAPTPPAAK